MSSRCLSCGQPVSENTASLADPAPKAAEYVSISPAPVPLTPELRELQGIGGWLLWFCIAVGLFQPLVLLLEAYREGQPTVVIIDIVLIGVCITPVILISRRSQLAFPWLYAFFIVRAVMALLTIVGNSADDVELTAAEKLSPFRTLVSLAIWFWYFKVSKRVYANFGRNL
jgi:hypothetical protein